MITHLILANDERAALAVAERRLLLRWQRVTGPHTMLGYRDVVLHIERGYIESPSIKHVALELPGASIAWGTVTEFPILRTIQTMIASGAIREVRQYA